MSDCCDSNEGVPCNVDPLILSGFELANDRSPKEKEDVDGHQTVPPIPPLMDVTHAFMTNTVFESREQLKVWCQGIARSLGFVVVTKRSKVSARTPRVTLGCERGGHYRKMQGGKSVKESSKTRGSKRIGCPFLLEGKKIQLEDKWMIQVQCGVHNHTPAKYTEGHSFAGRLNSEENEVLKHLTSNGVKPRDVLKVLKNRDVHNATTMPTVYNARWKLKAVEKAGRSQMQQLLHKLNEHKYTEWHRSDPNTDIVKDIFWAHPEAIQLGRFFPLVFLIDTYKKNRYRMPLLEIVGVTSTNLTFTFAQVYIDAEKQENYTWGLERMKEALGVFAKPSIIVTDRELALMNAIKYVFPEAHNFLCRWHISRTILVKCKNQFEKKEDWDAFISRWNDIVINSFNEDDYEGRLALFHSEFAGHPDALSYVTRSWLIPYKECFVAAWTDQVMHLGNNTTNRAESSHAQLKRHLGSSLGNFETSWNAINDLLLLQHTQIKASFEKSLNIVMHKFRPAVFKHLRGFISITALDLVLFEVERAQSVGLDIDTCGCIMRRTHGIPCAHEITQYQLEGQPIPLTAVHEHWKQLSFIPINTRRSVYYSKLDFIPDLQMLLKKIEESSADERHNLLSKIKELVNPSTTSLKEPEINTSVIAVEEHPILLE